MLEKAPPYQWCDGDETPRWECPQCGRPLILESRCPDCDWFNRDAWDRTLQTEGCT